MDNRGKCLQIKKEVKLAILQDNKKHLSSLPQNERFWLYLIQDHRIVINRYMKHLRYEQYYRAKGKTYIIASVLRKTKKPHWESNWLFH